MPKKERKHAADDRGVSTEISPDPEAPVEEIRLPPHAPTKGRAIDDPKPRGRKKAGEDPPDLPEEDDDTTGEMASAGQDLGLPADADADPREAGQFD